MRIVNIKIGELYRVKHNSYAWVRAVRIIPPMTPPNYTRATMVKCEWVVDKDDKFGLIKYYRASDLVKEKKGGAEE